jgi:8-oxo-dGTP pyrophosphatase MutT (NUDIX family)
LSAFTWPPESSASGNVARPPAGAQLPAAVLVALYYAGDEPDPHLVLTRRRADLRRHAGEISFPGGRRDAGDADLADTALREAEEEIGLARAQVRLIGQLPATSTFATNYVIHPFVGTIPAGVSWRPSAREVDAVLELPLSAVRAGRTRTTMERRGISFETDAYVVGEHLIWGATARIIEHLLERLRGTGPGGETLTLEAADGRPRV